MTRRRTLRLGVTVLLCWGWASAFDGAGVSSATSVSGATSVAGTASVSGATSVFDTASVSGATSVSAQTMGVEPVGSIPGPADRVRVQGDFAYVSAGRTFTVFDVWDPAAPRRLGSYTFPEEIWGFRLAGARAYVGANFFGLGILDISNPAAPTLAGSHKTLGQTKIGAVFGTKVVIIDHMEGLVMIDASNEAEPVKLDSYFLDGYARDVVTSGSFAYAVDSPSGLYLFDLSKPGPLEPVSVLHAPSAPRFIEVSSGSAAGQGPTIVCGAGGGNLQVYDVSDPAAPVRAATFETPGVAQRVSLDGTLAYVADARAGVQVVDLSTPSQPRLVGTYRTPRPARDVSVSDSHVFIVVGERAGNDREVLVLRRSY